MNHTPVLGLTQYEEGDKFRITYETDSVNKDMQIIEGAIGEKMDKPTNEGSTDQILRKSSDGSSRWDNAATQTEIGEAVTAWLGDNVPTGTTVVVDRSLSIEDAAADAKETGSQISNLKSAVNVIENNIVKGLTSKETGTADNTATGYVDSSGEYHSNSGYKSYDYYITPGKYDKLTATGANNANSPKNISFITFINNETRTPACLIASSDANIHTETVNVPSDATIVTICVAKNYVDTYGAPKVEFLTIDSITETAKKEETIVAENIAPEYLSHRYLNSNGTPASSTSNNWNLYKLDVSDIDDVDLTTYCNGGSKPMWAFYTVEYANADVTAMQNSENIVAVGENYEVDGEISKYIHVPTGAKTMSIVCYASQYTHLVVTTYAFGEARAFVQMPIRVKDLEDNAYRYIGSVYYRNVRWGCPSFENYYHSEDNGTSEFLSSTTAEQYFEKLNALVEDYIGYAESHEMGIASDESTMMYYYTFNPLTSQDSATYKRPKIIISAGQHGFEKTACFGLYWFIRNLLEDWQSNPFLSYVRNHVQLIIMPLLNPWGFDNDKYVNANGVNLNRNWDTTGWSSGTEGTTSYGGAEPLDQPETQYASAVILANLDALWLCDYHNNGQTAPGSAAGYLWHSFALVTYDDPYFKNAIDAAKWHIDETTGHLYVDYPDNCQYAVSGAWTDNNAPSHQGLIVAYAREHNIMAATMEGGAAFIDSGNRYSSPIHHMNADLIGNWIRCLLATFSHYAE